MKLLKEYEAKKQEIFDYFGYVEDWVVIPLDDATEYYWYIRGDMNNGAVRFAETVDTLFNGSGDYYENPIYTQRFLPKWVYEGENYTMICVDTRTDGNKFLQIFDNSKKIDERVDI